MISPFWLGVRELMREIAVELYMQDNACLGVYNTPELCELREGGYLDRARVLALRKVREEVYLKTLEEL